MFILSNMGKDQEFLEAARNGNITVVEKILTQKAKRTGPLASLRRGPGANVQDSSGYSALHHAALNGHTDIVRLLLGHDASTNLPDSRGSSALHLAAWAGHQDIVKIFLTHPHIPANPNLKTIENETPLHCAAQHGHTGALTTLLAHGADPNMINNRNETPLDLAAQYGRLQAVQMLIRAHPELLLPFKESTQHPDDECHHHHQQRDIVAHSPLHLASRNGHRQVVEVLLAAGVNVNLLTPSGTALHEAALCGKESVVRALLDAGANLDATDCEGRTALDILNEFPAHVTKGIVSVINDHRNSMIYAVERFNAQKEKSAAYKAQYNGGRTITKFQPQASSPSSSMCSLSSSVGAGRGPPSYSPPARPRASTGDLPTDFYMQMAPIKIAETDKDRMKRNNSNGHCIPTATNQTMSATTALNFGAPPKKPPRRNLSVSPTRPQFYQQLQQQKDCGPTFIHMSLDDGHQGYSQQQYEYIFMARTGDKNSIPSGKKNSNNGEYVQMQAQPKPAPRHVNPYENTAPLKSYNPNRKLKRNRDNYEQFSIDFNKDTKGESNEIQNDVNYPQSPTNYQQPPTPDHPPPSAMQAANFIHERIRPLSQEYKRNSILLPQNESLEFPDNEAPTKIITTTTLPIKITTKRYLSATGASDFIQRKQEQQHQQHQQHQQQRKNTKSSLYQSSLATSSGSLSSSVSIQSDRSYSTDCVEEYIGDVPFAGLFKGSTMNLNNVSGCAYNPIIQMETQQAQTLSFDGQPNKDGNNMLKEQQTTGGVTQQWKFDENDRNIGNRQTLPVSSVATVPFSAAKKSDLLSPFDENEAWAKISEIMESFGSGILTVVDASKGSCTDEIQEQKRRQSTIGDCGMSKPAPNLTPIGAFLFEHGLDMYEQNFLANGYDQIEFINGIFDEKDLDVLNIDTQDDRRRILEAIKLLKISEPMPKLQKFQTVLKDYTNINNNNNNGGVNDCEMVKDGSNNNLSTISNENRINKPFKLTPTVDYWLQSINLEEYLDVFRRHFYIDMDRVCQIWEIELQTVLEIQKIGHRKRILFSVSQNRSSEHKSESEINSTDFSKFQKNFFELRDDYKGIDCTNLTTPTTTPATPLVLKGETSSTGCNSSGGDATTTDGGADIVVVGGAATGRIVRHSIKKNRPAPQPPITRLSLLEIRAPSELLLGLPSNLRTKWRHPAQTLIANSVKYDVYYLGSTVVKELRGTESTRKSIQKLKRNDQRILLCGISGANGPNTSSHVSDLHLAFRKQQQQPVRLSISQRGVEFIDILSEDTICEHEIRNINCACQDADDLSHFAYITKDSDTQNTHYCHVFNVDSMDLATEIILTLGQAFEVAYQLALRDATTSPRTPLRTSGFGGIGGILRQDATTKNCIKNQQPSNSTTKSTTESSQ